MAQGNNNNIIGGCGNTVIPSVDNTLIPCNGEYISDKCVVVENGYPLIGTMPYTDLSNTIGSIVDNLRIIQNLENGLPHDNLNILFEWGDSDVDHPNMTTTVNYGGVDIKKHLLKLKFSDNSFLSKVSNPILFIDRKRRKGKRTGGKTRLAGWKHPRRLLDWNGRIFEIPITSNDMVLDFKQEYFFKSSTDPITRGIRSNLTKNENIAWVDLGFRIKYNYNGDTIMTPHLGHIRMFYYHNEFEATKRVISYRYQ